MLQITQAAVREFARCGRSPASQIAALDKKRRQAASGRVARDSAAVYAAADDGQIECFAAHAGRESVRATASRQAASLAARADSSIRGANCFCRRQRAAKSSGDGYSPLFQPAKYAAPRAVVSRICGRSTGASMMSAKNCIVQSEALMPPSTRKTGAASIPAAAKSSRIAPSKSRVWRQTDSNAARAISARPLARVSPKSRRARRCPNAARPSR